MIVHLVYPPILPNPIDPQKWKRILQFSTPIVNVILNIEFKYDTIGK